MSSWKRVWEIAEHEAHQQEVQEVYGNLQPSVDGPLVRDDVEIAGGVVNIAPYGRANVYCHIAGDIVSVELIYSIEQPPPSVSFQREAERLLEAAVQQRCI